MAKIGAHVSSSISLDLAIERAKTLGADCCQFFISPPQQWTQTEHSNDEIKNFYNAQKKNGVSPNFIHGTYLINLATDVPENLEKGVAWLIYALRMARELGIEGVIFHPGSHKGRGFGAVIDQMTDALHKVLSNSSETLLILENCAGSGGVIGNIDELGMIFKRIPDERLNFCLDTQHVFASGYNLSNDEGIEKLVSDIGSKIGWERLAVIHCNDSKVELGSSRDRHENIGEGFMGKKAFEKLLNHPNFEHLPFILEVPGFSGNGPDKENIDILRSLVSK